MNVKIKYSICEKKGLGGFLGFYLKEENQSLLKEVMKGEAILGTFKMLEKNRLENYKPKWAVEDLNGNVVETFFHHGAAESFKKEHNQDYFGLEIKEIKNKQKK
jgi:hypothetical protein